MSPSTRHDQGRHITLRCNDISRASDFVATDTRLTNGCWQRGGKVHGKPMSLIKPLIPRCPDSAYQLAQPGFIVRRNLRVLDARQSNGRDVPEACFACNSQRTRIGKVLADIAAIIDSGQHQGRFRALLEKPGQGRHNTIGRCS